jgi:hypothetical protein
MHRHHAALDGSGDLILADRSESRDVDADVDHAALLRPPLVDVPVEEPRTPIAGSMFDVPIVVVAVAPIWEVTEQDLGVADVALDLALAHLVEAGLEVSLAPPVGASSMTDPASVVVASEEDLAPAQGADEGQRVGELAEREVAEHPDLVIVSDDVVPSIDEGTVHGLGVGEGSSTVVDDVAVAEVEVGRVPGGHDAPTISLGRWASSTTFRFLPSSKTRVRCPTACATPWPWRDDTSVPSRFALTSTPRDLDSSSVSTRVAFRGASMSLAARVQPDAALTGPDEQLASPGTTLGQLQRGRGAGWLAASEASDAGDLLEQCLTHDPRWDSQVEARSDYYAQLATAVGVSASAIEQGRSDDEASRTLRLSVVASMADRAAAGALDVLRRNLVPGPHAHDVAWDLAKIRDGRGLEGLPQLLIERFDDDQLRELVRYSRKDLPWDEWNDQFPRLGSAMGAVDAEDRRRRAAPAERFPAIDAPIDVVLAHPWTPTPPNALLHRLTHEATPAEISAVRDAASRPWENRGWLPFAVLAKRNDPSAISVAEDVFVSGTGGAPRISSLRYVDALDPSITLPIARSWMIVADGRRNVAARLLARHAQDEDVALVREGLSAGMVDGDMYRLCHLIDALGRLSLGPFPELRSIFEETDYSYARRRAAVSMAATDLEFGERYATECLWDCESATREVGIDHAPGTSAIVARVRALGTDELEDPIVRASAQGRGAATERDD